MLGHDRQDEALNEAGGADSLASLAGLLQAVARTPRVPPVLPGTEVAGRYLILGVVGAGGMGVVYRARDRQLERDVAIKLCSRLGADDATHLLGEALAMARLSHPNVITVFEVGRYEDDLFVVMELVAGSTLRSWLRAARRPWREIVAVYLDAAAGLAAVHAAGLVHGDFKPDNVLVDGDGRVRLVDFGLARVGDTLLPAGGTPRYLAPEVRDGWFPSQRSDQYSFCVALAEALAEQGQRPRGVLRALARGQHADAFQRHESMAALRAELARTLGRRRRALAAAAALAAALVLALGGGWIAGRAEENRARAVALRRAALEADLEQGRRELGAGNVGAGLVYLSAALAGGLDRPSVRFLLARGLSAIEQTFVELPAGAPVTAVLFLRRGPRALVGDAAGRVGLFDVSGRRLRLFETGRGRIASLSADADGVRLLVAGDRGAGIWDVDSGALVAELPGDVGGRYLPDGRIAGWGSDGAVHLRDGGGRELARLPGGGGPILAVAASRDALATGGEDGTARVWVGTRARAFAHPQAVVAVDLDAGRLATGARDGVARVFDRGGGALLAELRHPESVGQVQLLPGGRLLTGCDDGVARIWDVSAGAIVTSLTGHTGPLTAARASPDDSRVITASSDGTVRVFDLATGRSITALGGHRQGVRAVALSATENLLLSGSDDGTARIWSIGSGGFIGSLGDGRYRGAWFSGRDEIVALAETGAFDVYHASAAGWDRVGAARAGERPRERRAASVSDDGRSLAIAGGRTLELWDLERRERLARLVAPADLTGARLSADGNTVAGYGAGAWVWSASACPVTMLAIPSPPVAAAALSPAGDRLALAHEDGSATLWSTGGLRLAELPRPAAPVVDLRFDPSGALLAVGANDGGVHLWDGYTGRLSRQLGRHAAPVVAVRFSPDGALLYSLGSDRKVRVWDVETGAELSILSVEAFGGLEVSPDGGRLLVNQSLGRVSLWDVAREPRAAQTVADLVGCLVPLRLDAAGRVVAHRPDPRCQ